MRKIEISDALYVALLNACACANDAVEEGFEDQAEQHPYGFTYTHPSRVTRPYSKAYEDLAKAWESGRSI